MKRVKLLTILLLVAIFATLIIFNISCSKKQKALKPKTQEVIKIGAILPLTGPLSFIGEPMHQAIEIIKPDLKNIEIKVDDAKSNANDAVTIANKWSLEKSIKIVLTTTTGLSRAILPIVVNSNKIFVSLCMDHKIQDESPNAIRFYYSFLQEGQAIANSVLKLNWSEVVILHLIHAGVQAEVDNVILPKLKENNVKVVLKETYELSNKDFKNIMSKIINSKCKNIILLGYGSEYPIIFKTIEEMRILNEVNILGGYGFIYYENLKENWLNKVSFVAPENLSGINKIDNTEFYKKFKKKYNKSPNFDALFIRDAIYFLSKQLENNQNDTEKLKKVFNRENVEFNGIMGKYLLNKGGDLKVNLSLFDFGENFQIREKVKDVATIY